MPVKGASIPHTPNYMSSKSVIFLIKFIKKSLSCPVQYLM